jgi:hypothetical protein
MKRSRVPNATQMAKRFVVLVIATVAAVAAVAAEAKVGTRLAVVPINTVAPSLTGIAQEGQPVGVSTGEWTSPELPSFAYQWQTCPSSNRCTDIAGATAANYVPAVSDWRHYLRVRVTASTTEGSASATAMTPRVSVPKPTLNPLPRFQTQVTFPVSWNAPPNPDGWFASYDIDLRQTTPLAPCCAGGGGWQIQTRSTSAMFTGGTFAQSLYAGASATPTASFPSPSTAPVTSHRPASPGVCATEWRCAARGNARRRRVCFRLAAGGRRAV